MTGTPGRLCSEGIYLNATMLASVSGQRWLRCWQLGWWRVSVETHEIRVGGWVRVAAWQQLIDRSMDVRHSRAAIQPLQLNRLTSTPLPAHPPSIGGKAHQLTSDQSVRQHFSLRRASIRTVDLSCPVLSLLAAALQSSRASASSESLLLTPCLVRPARVPVSPSSWHRSVSGLSLPIELRLS